VLAAGPATYLERSAVQPACNSLIKTPMPPFTAAKPTIYTSAAGCNVRLCRRRQCHLGSSLIMEGQLSIPGDHILALQTFVGFPIGLGLLLGIVMYAVRRKDFIHFLTRASPAPQRRGVAASPLSGHGCVARGTSCQIAVVASCHEGFFADCQFRRLVYRIARKVGGRRPPAFGLGPRNGAQVAPLQSPILRPGREHSGHATAFNATT